MYCDVQVGEGRELLVTATGAVPLPLRVRQLRGETTDIRLHPVQVRPVCVSVVALFPGLSHLRFLISYSLQTAGEGLGDPVVCDIMYLWMERASTVHVLTEVLCHKLLMCTYIQLYMYTYMYQHSYAYKSSAIEPTVHVHVSSSSILHSGAHQASEGGDGECDVACADRSSLWLVEDR